MQTWPAVSCGWGVHLTEGQPAHSRTKLGHEMSLLRGGTCDQGHHIHGHKMSLPGEGNIDILFDRQSASLPAAIAQPTSHVTKYQPVRPWVGWMVAGGQGA